MWVSVAVSKRYSQTGMNAKTAPYHPAKPSWGDITPGFIVIKPPNEVARCVIVDAGAGLPSVSSPECRLA